MWLQYHRKLTVTEIPRHTHSVSNPQYFPPLACRLSVRNRNAMNAKAWRVRCLGVHIAELAHHLQYIQPSRRNKTTLASFQPASKARKEGEKHTVTKLRMTKFQRERELRKRNHKQHVPPIRRIGGFNFRPLVIGLRAPFSVAAPPRSPNNNDPSCL